MRNIEKVGRMCSVCECTGLYYVALWYCYRGDTYIGRDNRHLSYKENSGEFWNVVVLNPTLK